MKGYIKGVLYLYAVYNLIMGLIAVFSPSLAGTIYGGGAFTPEFALAARWAGALAIGIAYGAFAAAVKMKRDILRLLLIAAAATVVANLLALFAGDATLGQVWFDFILQMALVVAAVQALKR